MRLRINTTSSPLGMQCLFMIKEDYNKDYKEEIQEIDKLHKKPTLFLHACCGPCLTYPLSELVEHFEVTVGYINPNIYPEEEYTKRLNELKRFISEFNKEKGTNVQVIFFNYNYEDYLKAVKGHEKDLEGGDRCTICHTLRLDESFKYAYEHKFNYFTTVMTVSSKKPSAVLNQICLGLQSKYQPTEFLKSDFKKEDGQLKGIKIAKEHNLYRQNYCGCSFSLQARIKSDNSR